MSAADSNTAEPRPRLDPFRRPIPYAFLLGTSFIGISWLLDPLFERLGWPGDFSRPHLVFTGAIFALAMTVAARWHTSASRPTA